MEDLIAQCVMFLERPKKKIGGCRNGTSVGCPEEIAMRTGGCRGRSQSGQDERVPVPPNPDDANVEVQRLKARLVQLESIHVHHEGTSLLRESYVCHEFAPSQNTKCACTCVTKCVCSCVTKCVYTCVTKFVYRVRNGAHFARFTFARFVRAFSLKS